MTFDQIERMARDVGLMQGAVDDEHSRLMLVALALFAQAVRAATLEETISTITQKAGREQTGQRNG